MVEQYGEERIAKRCHGGTIGKEKMAKWCHGGTIGKERI